MALINEHYLKLKAGYLFPEIARRVKAFAEQHPSASIIRMGIGDVTEPLPPSVVAAMHQAVEEMGRRESFRGYGPEQGYPFLREAIVEHDYRARGCDIDPEEIFVSDGSKCDCANILDILGPGNVIAVTDPVYPVYVDSNVMAGNAEAADERGEYGGLVYLRARAERGFLPALPDRAVDVVYLCSPNNPTGAVMGRSDLQAWVDYARGSGALLLFDAAYEAYIGEASLPRSIYEIDGARTCAVEFRSFSKTAGFTGVRAAFTVVPRELCGRTRAGGAVDLHRLWRRRHTTKYNGISYIVQRGAEAIYSDAGRAEVRRLIDHYMANARVMREAMTRLGFEVFGGEHAPYLWVRTPRGQSSWAFFDVLLERAHVVCTPGSGFGLAGEGHIRLSAFNSRANVEEAMARMARLT